MHIEVTPAMLWAVRRIQELDETRPQSHLAWIEIDQDREKAQSHLANLIIAAIEEQEKGK